MPEEPLQSEGDGPAVQGYYQVNAMCRRDYYRPTLPKVQMPNPNGFVADLRSDVR
ncbi:MAG: hypothetical protein OJF50_005718 [Nitrospira sp.]|nr:hypothetical protein [Nitrospira sp.]